MRRHQGFGDLGLRVMFVALTCTAIFFGAVISAQTPSETRQQTYGPIGPSETLWNIAKTLDPKGRNVSTAQLAWALYSANPESFEGSANRIRSGATLKIPETSYIKSVNRKLAFEYVMGKRQPPVEGGTKVAAAPAPAPLPVTTATSAAALQSLYRTSPEAQAEPRDSEARYQYFANLEERYAGDADFDYVYGTSAYDTRHYSEAVAIFQRALEVRPGFSGVRMDLARSYYAIGDNESARREFLIVSNENPPPEARRAIAEYLDAIDRRAAVYQSQLGGYLEGASGYDSNANGAPDLQNFLNFTLESRNQATDSAYYGIGAGGTLSHPFAPGWRALGDARASYRSYPDASFVDGEALRVGGGLEWRPNEITLSLQPNFTYARLDGEANHQNVGADFSTGYSPNDLWQLSFNTRYAQQRFVDALALQDVNTLLAGVAAQRTWLTFPRVQAGVALTAGQDDAQSATSPFGRSLFGGRASAALDFNRGRVLFAALSSLASDFDGSFFGLPRKDQQYSVALGMDWGVYRTLGWLLRGQVSYVDNQSDISLYDYNRIDAGLSLRKEFK